jgi:hypothetical protein
MICGLAPRLPDCTHRHSNLDEGDDIMGQHNTSETLQKAGFTFYRATSRCQESPICDYVKRQSPYLRDVLDMCKRGVWERELRQFLPPVSLREAVAALLEMGLIETLDNPYELQAA